MALTGVTNMSGPGGNAGTVTFSSGGATINVIPKGTGVANTLADSSITDTAGLVSTASTFKVTSAGTAAVPAFDILNTTHHGFYSIANTQLGFSAGSNYVGKFQAATGEFVIPSSFSFSIATNTTETTNGDVFWGRRAAGVWRAGATQNTSDGTVDLSTLNYRGLAQTYFVAANFTTAANTSLQNITGLGFTFPANIAMNVKLHVDILYSIATAAVAVDFGFQDVTVAPTNLAATALMSTSATAHTEATLAASATTTATSIVSATPSAITTIWRCQMDILVEHPSNASTSAFNIMVKTANSADLVTVYRGSSMTLQQ